MCPTSLHPIALSTVASTQIQAWKSEGNLLYTHLCVLILFLNLVHVSVEMRWNLLTRSTSKILVFLWHVVNCHLIIQILLKVNSSHPTVSNICKNCLICHSGDALSIKEIIVLLSVESLKDRMVIWNSTTLMYLLFVSTNCLLCHSDFFSFPLCNCEVLLNT